ncbi:hypothetical protein MMC21_002763 [Puttea exsequens]|nr:hypothetical protein [Puttea exsequens]
MASTTQYGDPALADATNTSQQQDSSAASQHKRTYQACIPCRRRKVRCDLGPVDDPHEPPCVRCRRESKDCFFSATRRKRKLDGGEDELGDDDNVRTGDEYVALNGRKKGAKIGNSSQDFGHRRSTGSLSATSPLNGYNTSVGEGSYQQPELYSTDDTTGRGGGGEGGAGGGEDPDQEVHNEAAAALFQSPINIPGDALHLLLKASKENEHLQRRSTEEHGRRSTSQTVQGPTSAPGDYRSPPSQGVRNSRVPSYPSNIDPAITGKPTTHGRVASRLLSTENLRLWSRLRFVRAGWFTAREAVQYLD